MKFSIVTPSFRNSAWLRLCIASVADQQGVDCEHIVQDSCSDDGTQEWLPRDPRVRAFIEKDSSMYDAINRGYRRATGDVLAYLNCDEQYLPGALQSVEAFFEQHPEIDVALAGSVVVDEEGAYLCHRPSLVPDPRHIWFRFPVLTCAVFLRRSVVHDRGLYFDTRWRIISDFHWVRTLMQQGVRMAVLDTCTSVFTETGDNLCLRPEGAREIAEKEAMAPRWVTALKPLWIAEHNVRRLAAGHFSLPATSYDLFTRSTPERRTHVEVPHPTTIWWKRILNTP